MYIKFYHSLLIFATLLFFACNGKEHKETEKNKQTPDKEKIEKKKKIAQLKLESPNKEFSTGDIITFHFQLPDTISTDSIRMYINNNPAQVLKGGQYRATLTTNQLPVGGNNFRFEVHLQNGQTDILYKRITLKSDIVPEQQKCTILKTYPHDPQAYTQGLFYDNGYLYEGTGHRGESSLRKVKLSEGELINSLALPQKYFGEGVTLFKDKIIQLTWTSRTGFVYDKEEFELINKVRYPTEGWGITTDGEKLIMSDGSQIIYFLDPEYFSEIGRIEVYDHKGPVNNLNELEYINGKVYANVWQESYIISFDPTTGKVLEKIDCSNLVPEKYKNHNDYVLNGIAYDKSQDRIFMTGKKWSKVYQVKFIPQ
jgi:glutamine cyclotransferase